MASRLTSPSSWRLYSMPAASAVHHVCGLRARAHPNTLYPTAGAGLRPVRRSVEHPESGTLGTPWNTPEQNRCSSWRRYLNPYKSITCGKAEHRNTWNTQKPAGTDQDTPAPRYGGEPAANGFAHTRCPPSASTTRWKLVKVAGDPWSLAPVRVIRARVTRQRLHLGVSEL
jgi:hypothetical protein